MLETDEQPGWTHDLASAAQVYVRELFDAELHLAQVQAPAGLPYFLGDQYSFLDGEILGLPVLFMAPEPGHLDTPAAISKHCRLVREVTGQSVVLLAATLTAYSRKHLIAHRVPFLVPGNQAFLPELALDLREHFRAMAKRPVDRLSPTAQLLVIAALLRRNVEDRTPSRLAADFVVTAMSLGRAFEELQATHLAQVRRTGREVRLRFAAEGRDLWTQARPLLQSPVRKTRQLIFLPAGFPACRAGETALADLTQLAPPGVETFAVDGRAWRGLAHQFQLREAKPGEQTPWAVQTWAYDPAILGREGLVDPLSLYLSLEGLPDPRVEMAAEHLLEEIAP